MCKAIWQDAVLAKSNACVQMEGNQYFPPDAVNRRYLKPSKHISFCPWKGVARYYDIEVNGHRNPNAAWYYPDPRPAAGEIRDRIAFWKGVRIENR